MKLKKFLLAFFFIVAVMAISLYTTVILPGEPVIPTIIALNIVIAFLAVWAAFKLIDVIWPEPLKLTGAEIKAFFMSKIFWSAFLIFIIAIINGLFNLEFTQDDVGQIVNLDWGNIVQAIIAVVIIVLRKVDLFKAIF